MREEIQPAQRAEEARAAAQRGEAARVRCLRQQICGEAEYGEPSDDALQQAATCVQDLRQEVMSMFALKMLQTIVLLMHAWVMMRIEFLCNINTDNENSFQKIQ